MRDPNRIYVILTALEEYWRHYPDLRLGQLVINLARDTEPYYFEDDELLAALEAATAEVRKKKGRKPR